MKSILRLDTSPELCCSSRAVLPFRCSELPQFPPSPCQGIANPHWSCSQLSCPAAQLRTSLPTHGRGFIQHRELGEARIPDTVQSTQQDSRKLTKIAEDFYFIVSNPPGAGHKHSECFSCSLCPFPTNPPRFGIIWALCPR